jgi:hypothetical protein
MLADPLAAHLQTTNLLNLPPLPLPDPFSLSTTSPALRFPSMTSETSPLLSERPPLESQCLVDDSDDETDVPPPPMFPRTVSGARRERFYEENEELKRCNVFQSV